MHHYRIGAFSQLSGISKDTFRYYDKAGVLSPSYKAENGYRFYTEYDLMLLMQVRTLRGLDSSLEECVHTTALPAMSARLSQREAELNQQIDQLSKLRDRIHMLQAEIENCLQQCGQCQQTSIIPTYRLSLNNMTEEKRQLIEKWMQHAPYVHLSFSFAALNESPEASLYFGILKSYADMHQLPVTGAESRPACPAVRCVLRMADPMRPTLEELSPIITYMQEKQLQPVAQWTYRLRFIDSCNGANVYYVGACVPVKRFEGSNNCFESISL